MDMKRRVMTWGSALFVGSTAMAQAAEPPSSVADWADAQPVASLSVRPLTAAEAPSHLKDREGLFVVEGAIVDLRSGHTLMKPRLIVHRGDTATIEGGVFDRVMMKLTVQIDATADGANTSTDLRDNGVVTSTSTTRFSVASI